MPNRSSSATSSYGIAILALAVAILIRAALTPWMGSAFPLATMFSAVAFAVWYGGWGPALLIALLGYGAGGFFIGRAPPPLVTGVFTTGEVVSFVVYLLANGSIIVLGEAMHRAQRRLEAQQQQLSTTNLALEDRVETQSLLAAIVASSDDAIVSKTLEGRITSWNKGAERLFGYPAQEAIGQTIHLIVPPEARGQVTDILDRIRQGRRVEHLDVERVRKDGARVQVSLTVSPVLDRHGRVVGASKTARDVTARKAWEAHLMRSEEAQRLLVGIHDATRGLQDPALVTRTIVTHVGTHFHATRCAYCEVSDDGDQITVNHAYARDAAPLAGRFGLDTFGPLLVAELNSGRTVAVADVRTDPLTDTPAARAAYEKRQIVAAVCVPLVRGGRLIAVLVMADRAPRAWTRDDAQLLEQVAERTLFAIESARATAALREGRDVLSFAMAAGRMGAWSRDLTLGTIWWSPELAAIVGLPPDDTDFRRDRLFELIGPEDRERLPRLIQQAMAERRDYAAEFTFRHARTGEWRWMEARGRAQYGPDGLPVMLYGLGIDITERVRAVEALQEADRRKDEFLATLAHELRNPLAPLSAGLHIMRTAGADAGAVAAARDIMERQVAQMVRLVDDLLDVARITTGKVELRCRPMDLADAVRDAAETVRPLIEAGGQRLTVSLPDTPLHVNADRTRLGQVFANLLNNGAKFSEPGQVVAVTLERDGARAAVRVRDAGMGIQPDLLPKVFDLFRQSDLAIRRPRGGLGIGLSLVKRITEMHGGSIDVFSEGPGRGSEFVVRIPAIEAPQAEAAPTAHAPAPVARRRVLVVDDNTDAAESLATLLSITGHDTRLAHDGVQAVEEARTFQPHVMFLDIGMPALDGHETARRIRLEPWGRNIVLVALTGWGQREDRRKSKEAGFDHHLVKPADPAVVAKLLARL